MAGKKISIGNFKGGVGKTLISYLLYKHFNNEYELMQSDLDSINNNILHIASEEDFKRKGPIIKDILSKKNLLIDTGGFLDDLQTYFFKKSDLIIVPLLLDSMSIKRTFLFIKYLLKEGINPENILIVINKFKKDQESIKNDFIDYMKEKYNISNFFIMNDYKSYQKVLDKNANLFEKPYYKTPATQLKQLHNTIKNILGE
jgi:cellulose biosynthesis protein BcsQ